MGMPFITPIALGSDKNIRYIIDYGTRTDGQAAYMGYAVSGTSTSESDWVIYLFTYNSDTPNALTQRDVSYGSWDNRASLVYG